MFTLYISTILNENININKYAMRQFYDAKSGLQSAEVPLPHHLPDPGQLVGDPGVHPGGVLPGAAQPPADHAHQHVAARGGGGDQGAATVALHTTSDGNRR